MTKQTLIESAKLQHEIVGYLAAVDAFRALGAEPTWQPELPAAPSLVRATRSAPTSLEVEKRSPGPPRFTV